MPSMHIAEPSSPPAGGFLQRACDEARARVAEAAQLVDLTTLRERDVAVAPSFSDALTGPEVAVIAEIKRASPSKGHLAWVPDPAARARAYADGGAAAVSVLTEPAHFHGTLGDLTAVVAAVGIPVIRKDFIVDEYQVWETRAAGASALLLIVAALDDRALARLLETTAEAGLDALVEVHDVAEARRAGEAYAAARNAPRPVVGVNARDLTTLQIDPDRFAACASALPPDALTVSESGIAGPEGVRRAAAAGADAVLVGEHLVTANDPTSATRVLADAGRP